MIQGLGLLGSWNWTGIKSNHGLWY